MDGKLEPKGPTSAFDSPTFGENVSFRLDKPVGSASISPCGRDIVLASRQGLHIIDLDSPYSPPRHLSHLTPWEVADVQWSPFAARDYWVVSTSNQKALVWNLGMVEPQASIEFYLHAHSRAITDINFSAHHPDILATCSVDSYVHCWDLRHPVRPAMTFCDWFAGATQVKWNRQDSHILASAHDKFLRIWDDRKGAYPLRSIKAHATKIYGIDWNRMKTNSLATCSLDKTIKFWDYDGDVDLPQRVIQTPFPVWRARHTPFGFGLLAMPQRGDSDLYLYDRGSNEYEMTSDSMHMVHRFEGHRDQVKEFLWRPRGTIENSIDDREFQLVTWGADRVLRLHCLTDEVLKRVNYEKGREARRNIPFSRKNAAYKTFREKPLLSPIEASLGSEARNFKRQIGSGMRNSLSLGMNKAPGGLTDGWLNERSMSSIPGKEERIVHDMDAILWMKGVKIGKRDSDRLVAQQTLPSLGSPSPKTDQNWDDFDSLADEITHVADKFRRITFEEINMQNRYLFISFYRVWGVERVSTRLKARIEFPANYPNDMPAIMSLISTDGLPDDAVVQIMTEASTIADAYKDRKKSSLEVLLRYSLGEQTLAESLTLLKARPDNQIIDADVEPDFSSSDEDDDDGSSKVIGIQAQGLEMSDSTIAISSAQYSVPLPKACGAYWADDGRLVCFFPSKQDKPSSLLGSLALKPGEGYSRNYRSVFEGFGRLHASSILAKRASSNLDTVESDESDHEDFSTSSESSSENELGVPELHLMPPIASQDEKSDQHQTTSIDDSQRSSGHNAKGLSTGPRLRNFVSIHNFADILPSKQTLANEYVLDEDLSMCCIRNAEVARAHGEIDLADVWSLIYLILRNEVPTRVMQMPRNNKSIVIAARRAIGPLKGKDSGIDISSDFVADEGRAKIQWGYHPFGRRWLVKSLFERYEQLADIQMLAMLSCVFQEPRLSNFLPSNSRYQSGNASVQLSGVRQSELHSDSLRSFFPSWEMANSILNPSPVNPTFRLDGRKPTSGPHSANSSVGASTSDPVTPFSVGATPPSSFKAAHISFERTASQTPISTSPERYRNVHRSSSNLASAFAASISRPFSFSASVSTSPPMAYPRKRLSPAQSYLHTSGANTSTGQGSVLSRSLPRSEDPKFQYPPSVSDIDEETSAPKEPIFWTRLKNQDQFQNDGHAIVPLLDTDLEWRYHAYREIYAHLLSIWDLPIKGCEILHYHSLYDQRPDPWRYGDLGNAAVSIGRGGSSIASTAHGGRVGLDLMNVCSYHGEDHALHANEKNLACSRAPIPLLCLFCDSIIRGLSSPCLNCGHALHVTCRALAEQSQDGFLSGECISGCGCYCSDHVTVEVSIPSTLDDREIFKPVHVFDASEPERLGGQDIDEGNDFTEDETWEDVAYESLARNLGGRSLTPKPSQIWRGEGRKRSVSAISSLRRTESR